MRGLAREWQKGGETHQNSWLFNFKFLLCHLCVCMKLQCNVFQEVVRRFADLNEFIFVALVDDTAVDSLVDWTGDEDSLEQEVRVTSLVRAANE